uniref:DUF2203 family protein n=1 Tax=Heterorhabditis bacteriophora TaxID=37862 RepID=A0A1I7WLY1_HETBA
MKQIADAVKRSRKATMKFLRHQKEEGIVPLMLQKIRVETAGQVSQYCTITDEEILTTDQDERLRLVTFSDENKFNLDGPDGWYSYWSGGSIMVWGAFSAMGLVDLAFM